MIEIETSVGELFDKISILQIKQQKVIDKSKLKNIEKELLNKNIDIAVHALKDMPAIETDGLRTDTFLERNDPREILITKNKKKLKDLKTKAVIGTSSYRREFQIKKIRSDLNCKLIRGNVDTRIKIWCCNWNLILSKRISNKKNKI